MSLESAYGWLLTGYDDIYIAVIKMIAADQEEPLPLRWADLVEDWDYAYWIVWLFIILLISIRDGELFARSHGALSKWLAEVEGEADTYYAEEDEKQTIDTMVQGKLAIPLSDIVS